MDYQALCDELRALLIERDHRVPENGYEALAQKVCKLESRVFDDLTKNHREPQHIAWTATTMIIYAGYLGVESLQQALDRIEREEIDREKIVAATLARLRYEIDDDPYDHDAKREIVWRTLTS
jgi:hypothetical protein